MSILDNGLLKCALVITDTTRNVSHTQNSYSLCDQERRHTEDSGGDSVSVPGKSGSHRLKYESLRKLRAVCSLDPRGSKGQQVGRGPRVRPLQWCEVDEICLHLLFYCSPHCLFTHPDLSVLSNHTEEIPTE